MQTFYRTCLFPRRKLLLSGFLILLTFFRWILFLRIPLNGVATPDSPDWNLLLHAESLSQGGWLGALDDSTLSLGISFPFFVLLCSRLCLPVLLGAGILYTGSILLFLREWKTIFSSRKLRILLYIFLLYSPVMLTESTAQSVWDQTVAPACVLLLLACSMGMLNHVRSRLFPWALGTGIILCFFLFLNIRNWWILPLFVVFVGWIGFSFVKKHVPRFPRKLVLLFLPLFLCILGGLGISLLNAHYYGTFRVFHQTAAAKNPSAGHIFQDSLSSALGLASQQHYQTDTYTGQGSLQDLRRIESITGSQVIYPNPQPLTIRGWAFATNELDHLEVAVINQEGQPVAYAEFENSEDVFMEFPEYSASRVCRFTLTAPVTEPEDYSLGIFLNGQLLDEYSLEHQATEQPDYLLFLDEIGLYQDPVLFSSQRAVVHSQRILFLYAAAGIPLLFLSAVCYLSLLIYAIRKKGKNLSQILFVTGAGLSAFGGILLAHIPYSGSTADPLDLCAGPSMLIQVLLICSIWWGYQICFKHLSFGKRKGSSQQ